VFALPPKEFLANPEAMRRMWSLTEALAYTHWLAHYHYENFHIVTFLLPKHLHQDFYNVYAFCRWADDLGDEIGDTTESLRLLAWWDAEITRMYSGQASHPVFVALAETATRHSLPATPFHDLVRAFVQDQTVTRYETWDQLFNYCRYSANPVGRLVLYLCGYSDPHRQELSDHTCTALQLANFWQDVAVDLEKSRIYLPLEVLQRHHCPVEEVLAKHWSEPFQNTMLEAIAVARREFDQGEPLIRMVNRRLALDLDLFTRGGRRILDRIEQQQCDVFRERPSIGKSERIGLLLQALTQWLVPRWRTRGAA
jgi:squalene synthase HpnC